MAYTRIICNVLRCIDNSVALSLSGRDLRGYGGTKEYIVRRKDSGFHESHSLPSFEALAVSQESSGAGGKNRLEMGAARNPVGVTPVCFRNHVVKCEACRNPRSSATSFML